MNLEEKEEERGLRIDPKSTPRTPPPPKAPHSLCPLPGLNQAPFLKALEAVVQNAALGLKRGTTGWGPQGHSKPPPPPIP